MTTVLLKTTFQKGERRWRERKKKRKREERGRKKHRQRILTERESMHFTNLIQSYPTALSKVFEASRLFIKHCPGRNNFISQLI